MRNVQNDDSDSSDKSRPSATRIPARLIQVLPNSLLGRDKPTLNCVDESPLTVREAAKFLGVSSQTVYLWVERKQIPHLRVMGRNIRFLKIGADLIPRVIQTGDGE